LAGNGSSYGSGGGGGGQDNVSPYGGTDGGSGYGGLVIVRVAV
jgi:hypothetical protein